MTTHGEEYLPDPVSIPHSISYRGPFGRLFRHLPPWQPKGKNEAERESDLLKRARRMLEKGPPDPSAGHSEQQPLPAVPENPKISAGYTYLGQFVAHDLTFDPTTMHQRQRDPERLSNFRTPRLDLDHVYGSGPRRQPSLFDQTEGPNRGFLFLIGGTGGPGRQKRRKPAYVEEDLPRNPQGLAVIPDDRDDSHVILSQMHLAFLKFHNAVMERLQSQRGLLGQPAFEEAQRLTRWHYQWVVVHDYLAKVVGATEVRRALALMQSASGADRLFEWKDQPFMPVEFSAGAYRFGHSMVRGIYQLNDRQQPLPLFAPKPRGKRPNKQPSLVGGRDLPKDFTISWSRFFPVYGEPRPQRSRLLLPKVPWQLSEFPGKEGEESLAERDFRRGVRLGVPSGQDVARAIGFRPLDPKTGNDPLWYYVLKEAESVELGRRLGPVGRRIVAEVLIGLLEGDPGSYLSVDRNWVPPFLSRGRRFGFVDFLRFAGMPVADSDLPWNADP